MHPTDIVALEYSSVQSMTVAEQKLREWNTSIVGTYSPFPTEETHLSTPKKRLISICGVAGAAFGFLCGYLLEYYTAVMQWPLNIGGRPLNSLPMFLLPAIELAFLFSSLAILASLLGLTKLPALFHPVFNSNVFINKAHYRFFIVLPKNEFEILKRQSLPKDIFGECAEPTSVCHEEYCQSPET